MKAGLGLLVQVVQHIPGVCESWSCSVLSPPSYFIREELSKSILSSWECYFHLVFSLSPVLCVCSGFGAAGCDPRPVHGGWRSCPGSDQSHPEASQEGERPLGWDKTFSFPLQQSGKCAAESAFLIKHEAPCIIYSSCMTFWLDPLARTLKDVYRKFSWDIFFWKR